MPGPKRSDSTAKVPVRLYQPLVPTACALAAGVMLDRYWPQPVLLWIAALVASLALWFLGAALRWKPGAPGAFLLAVHFAGAAWHHHRQQSISWNDLSHRASEIPGPAMVEGVLLTNPVTGFHSSPHDLEGTTRVPRSRFTFSPRAIRDRDQWISAGGRTEVFVEGDLPGLYSGHRVTIAGKLSLVPAPGNPGEFDRRSFFHDQGIRTWITASAPSDIEIARGSESRWSTAAGRFRAMLDAHLHRYLSSDHAGLASAMLLGNRDQIDQEERDQFMLTGTIHVLSISGLHVGILAGFVAGVSRLLLLPRNFSLWLIAGFVLGYAWLVEFRPPVVRATVLVVVFCYARWAGREAPGFNTLAFAAILLIVQNPAHLFSIGAQLSFLAVGAMVFGRSWMEWRESDDPLDQLIARARPWHQRFAIRGGQLLWSSFMVSLVVWCFAMPLVAARFHVVSPVALVVNPLVMIPVAFAMASGLVILATGAILPPAASLAGRVCDLSLQSMKWLIEESRDLPGSCFWTCGPAPVALVVFYFLVVAAFVLRPVGVVFSRAAVAFLIWVGAGWVVPRWVEVRLMESRSTLACTVLDVGHGNCVLLELPGGKSMLCDCGSMGSPQSAARKGSGVIWAHRLQRLDAVLISHADADHFNGIPEIVRLFRPRRVFVSDAMMASRDRPDIAWLLDALARDGICPGTLSAGELIELGEDVELTIVAPARDVVPQSDNEASLVLDLQWKNHSLLLTGDLEGASLDRLLETPARRPYDLVTVPHHGSPTNRPAEFLAWAKAELAVICGRRGVHENPDASLVREGLTPTVLAHTGRDGAVRNIFFPAGDTETRTFRHQPW